MKEKSLFTIDAKILADEFCKSNSATDHSAILWWFANAIMQGYDKGVKHASQEDVEVCCQDFHSYENAYACRKHCE